MARNVGLTSSRVRPIYWAVGHLLREPRVTPKVLSSSRRGPLCLSVRLFVCDTARGRDSERHRERE